MARRRQNDERWIRRGLAWVAVVALLVAVVALAVPPKRDTIPLSGRWNAEMGGQAFAIDVPGRFANHGVPGDGRVVLDRLVDLPKGTGARVLHADHVLYATRVLWDDVEIAKMPDPASSSPADDSLLVALPPNADGDPSASGPHKLTLDVKGAYGGGGVLGEVEIAPLADANLRGMWQSGGYVGLTLGLALLAVGHLAVAERRPTRSSYLYFGLLCATIVMWSFLHLHVLPTPLLLHLRLVQTTEAWACGLAILFLSSLLGADLEQRGRWIIGAAGALGVLWWVVPAAWMYRVAQFQDAVDVGTIVALLVLVLTAFLRDQRHSGWLLLALLPATAGLLDEALLEHGLRGGTSHLYASFTLLAGAASAVLALRHAEDAERHARLVSESVDAMVSVDPFGRITLANPAAQEMLGGSRVVGASILRWVSADDVSLVRSHLSRGLDAADRAEFRLRGKSGVLNVESIATPLDPETTLLVLRDVTRRRQIDQGLLQAARMETVGMLVGGIAHDFNNMLSTVLAHVGLMQLTAEDQDTKNRLDRIESTVERASLLTRRLLTIAGGTSSDLVPLEVVDVCRAAAELVEPTLPSGVELEVDVPDDLPPVLGAGPDLEQVLVNLMVNARDAIAPSGKIRLLARLYEHHHAKGVAIVVEDNGPGVPAALKAQIFDPFFTTKGPRGSGLGLAVASQILRDHYGRLWLEDNEPRGARFCIALRIADAAALTPPTIPEHRRILLVDDEPPLLDSFASALRDAGFSVVTCRSGHEAWPHLQRGDLDILVTDVVMPGISGLELAAGCADLHPHIPVLLVSGFIPKESMNGLPRGAWYRLDKPVRNSRLVNTVARLLRRAERLASGDIDVTEVSAIFPPLDDMPSSAIRW